MVAKELEGVTVQCSHPSRDGPDGCTHWSSECHNAK